MLLREVLHRVQFRYSQAQLEELDDETLDDDVRQALHVFTYERLFNLLLVFISEPYCPLADSVAAFVFGFYSNRQSGSGTYGRV